jgi:hypothetical protein
VKGIEDCIDECGAKFRGIFSNLFSFFTFASHSHPRPRPQMDHSYKYKKNLWAGWILNPDPLSSCGVIWRRAKNMRWLAGK